MPALPPEIHDLIAMTLVPGLGPRLTAALLERFGSASAARRASAEELRKVPHIGDKLSREFAQALRNVDVAAEIERLEHFGVQVRWLNSPEYPASLATIHDPPQLLYLRGNLVSADSNAVAIVGSRQCTPYGKRITERLASGLARADFTVISGLARGIDASAHRGALDAGGRTIAVLAGGLSSIYPPEHLELSQEVELHGALISETPMSMDPQRGMFHARNRLISGLARAVVVVEANERSGSLITARHAAEQGREVFAIPANADSTTSKGSLQLLRNGARLIRDIDDLLEDLKGIAPIGPAPAAGSEQPKAPSAPPPAQPALEPTQSRIWELLGEPKHIDVITRELGLTVVELGRILMQMEMKKHIRRLPGNLYERRS
jgi:DNA processing protein